MTDINEIKSLVERNIAISQAALDVGTKNFNSNSEVISMLKDLLAAMQTIIALCSKSGSGELLAALTQLRIAVEQMSGKVDTLIAKANQ